MEQAFIKSSGPRQKILGELADLISSADHTHPLRIAVDGIDASGKTCLANELEAILKNRARKIIRASADGFHRPKDYRYRQGKNSPLGYFEDSIDNESIISFLLAPLGPEGNGQYWTKSFDHKLDSSISTSLKQATKDEILIFDGIFLMRHELREYWDFVIFTRVSFETALDRALRRDVSDGENIESIRQLYLHRYFPGQRIYLEACRPEERADIVLINEPLENPELCINLHDLH